MVGGNRLAAVSTIGTVRGSKSVSLKRGYKQHKHIALAAAAVVVGGAGMFAQDARASSANWTGASSNVWQLNGNWTGAFPSSGDTATFNSAPGAGGSAIDVGSGLNIGSILFDTSSAASYNIGTGAAGSESLTLGTAGGGITMNPTVSRDEMIAANVILAANTSGYNIINNSSTNTLYLAGNVSASIAGAYMDVSGSGNTVISGMYNGGTGTLGLEKTGTGTLTLSGGGTFNAAVVPDPSNNLFSTVLYGGSTIISSGAYNSPTEFVVGGASTTGVNTNLTLNGGSLTVSSWLSLGRGNGYQTVSSSIVENNNAAMTSTNFSAGYNAGINGPTGSMTLNNASTYTLSSGGNFNLAESSGSNITMTLNNSASVTLLGDNGGNGRFIGEGGTGTLNINGTAAFNNAGTTALTIGFENGVGVLNMSGGTFNSPNAELRVAGSPANGAYTGTGTINMTGGNASVGSLTMSRGNNNQFLGNGTLNISGGTFRSEGDTILGFAGAGHSNVIISGTGTYNEASTVTRWFMLGYYDATNAEVDVEGGNLNLNANTSIKFTRSGSSGVELLNQTGGNVNFYSDNATTIGGTGQLDMQLAGAATSFDQYNLSGGVLNVPQIISTTTLGTRNFYFNGGTMKATPTDTYAASFMTAGRVTNAWVGNGGAIIDNGGNPLVIGQVLTHSGVGTDNAIDGGLTSQGSGSLTLTGSNTYTGPTTVNAGTLILTGTDSYTSATNVNAGKLVLSGTGSINPSSLIAVGSGAKFVQLSSVASTPPINLSGGTLDGTGTVGPVSVSNSISNILTSGNGSIGQLTVGSLTFSGAASINLTTNMASNASAGIIANAVTTGSTAGQVKFNLATTDASWATGTYDLLGYTGTIGGTAGFSAFSLGTVAGITPRQTPTLINNATLDEIQLQITGVSGALIWTGSTNSNWTTNASAVNWNISGGSSTNFQTGDSVTFDDTAASSKTTVSISDTTVNPTTVAFNNSANTYTITGPGSINGSGGVTLLGPGTVNFNSSNSYTGGTSINNGKLDVNTATAIGTGTLTINGGTVDTAFTAGVTLSTNNPQVWGAATFGGSNPLNLGTGGISFVNGSSTVTVNGTAPVTAGGAIAANVTGTFTKLGNGTLILTGNSSFGGLTVVNAGTLIVTGTGANLNSTINVANGTGFTGTMNIASGAVVTSPNEVAVTNEGGSAALNVLNGGTLNANSFLSIGRGLGATNSANATLNVLGGTINVNNTGTQFVTGSYGGSGNVAVTNVGYGSDGVTPGVINSASELWIGDDTGTGTMNLSNGAQINSSNWLIVGRQGGVGTLNISGNATINKTANNNFFLAYSYSTGGATGVVNQNGGTITSAAALGFANIAADSGTYNLNGGTLTVPQVFRTAGTGIFNFNGGTLKAYTGANAAFMTGLTSANVLSGGAIIDTNGQTITVAQPLLSGVSSGTDGGLTKQGAGTLTISSSANSYNGPTIVKAGTLVVNPVPQTSLLASYSFDNVTATPVGTPTTITNLGTSGSAQNGTVIQAAGDSGSVQIVSGGPSNFNGGAGNSLAFDGAGGTVNISAGSVNLSSAANWTVSLWVQTSETGATMFSKDSGGWTTGNSIFYLQNGTSGGGAGTYPGAVRYAGGFVAGSQGVPDGNWHMVTFVDNAGTKSIYVDGTQTTLSQAGFTTADVGNTIQLGYSPDTVVADGTVALSGNLDDINFYNGTLNATQITSLYNTNTVTFAPTPNTTLPVGTPLNISAGSAVISAHAAGASSVAAQVASLQLGGTTNAWSGILDLTNNGIDITTGSKTTITNQLKSGYSNGTWNGTAGILSSTAAADTTHLTAVGMLVNDNGSGKPYYGTNGLIAGTFDGIVPADGDVLLKYTYYGDANLDGTVNSADYARIDAGYLAHATGWWNGDFNYDGVVNGSDYTLIDNAFNMQGAAISAQIASPTAQIAGGAASAVPEPTSLALVGFGVVGLLGRRSRRGR
jgi:autotransporter-associated beta strand protein